MEVVMGPLELMKVLPHRFPFLLLDRLLQVQEGPEPPSRLGRKALALKNVTINEPFFPGHFPHRPVMPGVLIIEAMAQAGCMAVYRSGDSEKDVAIASVREAKFRRPVVPGDTLHLSATVIKDRGQMIVLACQAHVEGQLVAEAEILASITPRSSSH